MHWRAWRSCCPLRNRAQRGDIGDGAGVLWVLPLTGERKAVELIREEYSASGGRLSPDSRFLAYGSNESGRGEVYVRAFDPSLVRFPPAGGKWQVSDQGGTPLQWRQATEVRLVLPLPQVTQLAQVIGSPRNL